MPTLNRKFNWGSRLQNENPDLYRQLSDAYEDTSGIVNTKISRNIATSDPSNSAQVNKNFDIGDIHVNRSTNNAWIMTSRTTDVDVTWTKIT